MGKNDAYGLTMMNFSVLLKCQNAKADISKQSQEHLMLPVWEHPKSIVDSHTLHQHCSLKIEKTKEEK